MNSRFLKSSIPNNSTKNANNLAVKINLPKLAMTKKPQDGVETRGFEKENTGHRLEAFEKRHEQQVKTDDRSEQLERDSTMKTISMDHRQSHRYKPYETTRRYNSIPVFATPTSGVSRNSIYNENSDLASPKKSSGLIPVSINKDGSIIGSTVRPMPSSKFLAKGNVSLNSTMSPNLESKKITSTPLQSTNQKKSNPLAGKDLYGLSTASVQMVGSAGVSSETQFSRLDSTKINEGSSRDNPVVEAKKLPQQQNLDLSKVSCVARNRRRLSVSKKKAQEQLLHYLNEIVDIQEILYSLSNDSQTRKDFLDGAGGAPRLALTDLKIIETIHRIITSCKRPKSVNEFILNQEASQQQSSEHFKLLMEGRDEIPDGANASYLEGKLIIQRVLRSGYFRMRRYNANVKLEI